MDGSFPRASSSAPYLAIWTRDIDAGERVGRLGTASAIREVIRSQHACSEAVMSLDLRHAAFRLVWGAISLRFVPLQCALFALPRDIEAAHNGQAPRGVYVDGIRAIDALRTIRRQWPDARIVCDFDDLMSRRMQIWRTTGAGVSLGFVERCVPPWLARRLRSGLVARLVLAYEERALRAAELEAIRLSDRVTLVSRADAAVLREHTPPELHDRIAVIPPPTEPRVADFQPDNELRFAFVGSDKLAQNRLTIDYLVRLWAQERPPSELHVFGRQGTPWPSVANVTFHGFVEDISSVYDGSTVLLAPSFIPGGIKTKVLEAFSFSAPVIGNATTFEGLPLQDYPLAFEDDNELRRIIREPIAALPRLRQGATEGRRMVEDMATSFPRLWTEVLSGEPLSEHASFKAETALEPSRSMA